MALKTDRSIVSTINGFDALFIYDGAGKLMFHCEKGAEISAALNKNISNIDDLNSASWIPEDVKNHVFQSKIPGVWHFKINQGSIELFDVTLWLLQIEARNSQIIVQFDWVWQRDQDSRTIRLHLLQMARLACVGSLGGALAHALNNPLATIRGFAEVLKRRFEQIEKVGYFSDKIVSNADRMKLIIDELRQLSRPSSGVGSENVVDLNTTIEGTAHIMEEQFKMRSIALETHLDAELKFFKGDPFLWESLFLSLLALSRDSFQNQNDDRKKKIIIETFMRDNQVGFCYTDTSGGLPVVSDVKNIDSLSLLQNNDAVTGLPGFVVLEVLKRHNAQIQWNVTAGDSTEIVVMLSNVVERPVVEEFDLAI